MTYQDKAPCTNALTISQMANVSFRKRATQYRSLSFVSIWGLFPYIEWLFCGKRHLYWMALSQKETFAISIYSAQDYRALLRKMTYQDKASYGSLTCERISRKSVVIWVFDLANVSFRKRATTYRALLRKEKASYESLTCERISRADFREDPYDALSS